MQKSDSRSTRKQATLRGTWRPPRHSPQLLLNPSRDPSHPHLYLRGALLVSSQPFIRDLLAIKAHNRVAQGLSSPNVS